MQTLRKEEMELLKKSECQVLDFIDEVCKKHNFVYCLSYGTLLGSIRHKGFIPWDDDIDIVMPRESYDAFEKYMEGQNGRFQLLSYKTDPEYPHNFYKIIDTYTPIMEEGMENLKQYGAFVDVIPLDGSPNNSAMRHLYCWFYTKMCSAIAFGQKTRNSTGVFDHIKCKIGYFYRHRMADQVFSGLTHMFKIKNSKYVGTWVFGELPIPKEALEECLDGEFEGKKYPIPKGYELLLRIQYGDYMQLPPVEDRVSEHKISICVNEEQEI